MDKKLTDKQKKLITDNYKLLNGFVEYAIKKHIIPQYLEDEFISDMHLKFCFSALKYNIDTGFKFSTYAYGGFNFGIRDITTRKKKKFEKIQYISKINEDNLKEYKLDHKKINLIPNNVENFVSSVELTLKERFMLEDYYYHQISFSGLGKKYNISKEGARIIIKRVLVKLKKAAIKIDLEMEDFYK